MYTMHNLKLVLLLLCALLCSSIAKAENVVGPTNLILCNKAFPSTAAAATTTQAVPGVAGQNIQLCGWEVTSNQNGSTTFQFEYGTGATCTSPTIITPPFSITSAAPSVDRISSAWRTVPAGASICMITVGATVGIAALLYYSQF